MCFVGYAQTSDIRQLEQGCTLAIAALAVVPSKASHRKLCLCWQIEPPPPTATELLAEQQAAAPTDNGGAAPGEFQPQPPGSNNPFGQNASFGAPPGSFTQVRSLACPALARFPSG